MKNNLLLYSIIFSFAFVILKIILNSYNLDFMYSVYQMCYFWIYIITVIGIFQVTKENKILLVISILIILVISFILMIGTVLSYKTVKVITIDNQKVVVETFGLPDDMDYYYKYINFFLKSYNEIKPAIKTNSDKSSDPRENDIVMKFHNTTINTPHYD